MTGRHRPPRKPRTPREDDVPELSPEEVERRVDLRGGGAQRTLPASGWIPALEDAAPRPVTIRRGPDADPGRDRRLTLWRDSATILIGVILALLGARVFLPTGTAAPAGSASAFPSGVAIGSLAPPVSLAPGETGETFGPIIDPSIGIDATPTPIPVITMGPTPSPTPIPAPTGSPKPTPKPSKIPVPTKTPVPTTPTPTGSPTPTEEPTLPPTPTPAPNAVVSCQAPVVLTVTCDSSSTNVQADSENWSMGGPGVLISGGDGSGSITWTYTDPGQYTVTLTVTGLNGSSTDSATASVTVP